MIDWNFPLEKVINTVNYLMIDSSRTRYFTRMNKAGILLSGVDIPNGYWNETFETNRWAAMRRGTDDRWS